MRIAQAGNTTHGFPLAILARRGFTVTQGPDADDDLWALHPDGTCLIAETPLALLGLLAIVDVLGPDWYHRPLVVLPRGRMVALTPDELARLPDEDLDAARSAFVALAVARGRPEPGSGRDELVEAARAWIEETARRAADEELD
jgi:hypothetical protein